MLGGGVCVKVGEGGAGGHTTVRGVVREQTGIVCAVRFADTQHQISILAWGTLVNTGCRSIMSVGIVWTL